MKKKFIQIIFAFICSSSITILAQTSNILPPTLQLYETGKRLFEEKNFAAAILPLQNFVRQAPESFSFQEAEYMLACSYYELKDVNSITILRSYLKKYPDSPHSNRIYALIASHYFFEEKYDEALAIFNSVHPNFLSKEEQAEMTYQLAICNLKTGKTQEAAIRFATLKTISNKYNQDCLYYTSYIRYTQQKYEVALDGFLQLQNNLKYKTFVPYYIAQIYLIQKQYSKAKEIAKGYLKKDSQNKHSIDMYRILGESYYYSENYQQATKFFQTYLNSLNIKPQRNIVYMLGLAYYKTKVFSKAAATLGEITTTHDELTQNAYLHMGLAYLQLAEKNKARMAFEQAAADNTNLKIKEQAAYNYALCIHDTSFSAFGESVNAFEQFLNEFPKSQYTEEINSYLVEVYMNTRNYQYALKSIDRISNPGMRIMEAKQKILFQLGLQAFTNSSFEEAMKYFTKSISLGQYNRETKANSFYWRGETFYRLHNLLKSSNDFKEYLSISKTVSSKMYPIVHYNLGYINFEQKNYSQAENWFIKYINLEKEKNSLTLADTYNRIGDCNFYIRNFSTATEYYSKAESMNTSNGDYSFYQLAIVSGLQKDYSGKITLLNRLMGKYPSSPYITNALYEKGRSYVQMNNNKQAINTFKELAQRYPQSPISRKASAEIGLLYYQDEDYSQAIKAYKNVITQYPESEEAELALRDLKSIYIDTNRISDFTTLVSSLPGNMHVSTNEQDSLTYVAAEKIYMRKNILQAQKSLNSYLEKYPNGAFKTNAHYYLCLIGEKQRNDKMVLDHSAEILKYPNNQFAEKALIFRSEILFKQKKYNETLELYKQLQESASTYENRSLAQVGILRSAYLGNNDSQTIDAANNLLSDPKINPELRTEATYDRAKSYLKLGTDKKAMTDLRTLSKDTRNIYGAEAKYLIAQKLYDAKEYESAEKELLDFIDKSTPHAYWLARGFILLSDVYVAMNKKLDARQYLLSLQQNYHADDNIKSMIKNRLQKLNK